jgi:hypothetical protein
MPILNITTDSPGLVGVNPKIIYIETSDDNAAITTAGYLNKAVSQGNTFSNQDLALVYGTDVVNSGPGANWYQVEITGDAQPYTYSLAPITGSGTVDSVSGTANRITSTGGANPVIDISAAYVGQTSLTTLGTIATGTWHGSTIDIADGGTGATSLTPYAVLCGGTTSTGPVQPIAGVGTSGFVLTSNGAGALPTFQAGGSGTITTVGDVTSGPAFDGTAGTTLTSTDAGLTLQVGGTAAGLLLIQGGTPAAVGAGGAIDIFAGDGGSSSGNGGQITLLAGSATSGVGGELSMQAGNSSAGVGGVVFLEAGASTGTNQAGAALNLWGGAGTGTGAPGQIIIKGDATNVASGTSPHSLVNRLVINGSVTGMTSGSASTLATFTLANGTTAGGTVFYTVECTDGTNYQMYSGQFAFALMELSSSFTGTTADGTNTFIGSGGTTLTVASGRTNNTITLTATTSIATPTVFKTTFSIFSHGQTALTVA